MIDDDVHEFEFNEKFQVIETPFPLREMPPHVINDLSTDQNYSYRVARMLITGEIDWDLIHLMIGKLTHSRWEQPQIDSHVCGCQSMVSRGRIIKIYALLSPFAFVSPSTCGLR